MEEVAKLDDKLKKSVDKLTSLLDSFKLDINANLNINNLFDQMQSFKGSIDLISTEDTGEGIMVVNSIPLNGQRGRRDRGKGKATIKVGMSISTEDKMVTSKNEFTRNHYRPQPMLIPDKVLETIFFNLPMHELVSIRRVSQRWRKLIHKVICDKKCLKLSLIKRDATTRQIRSEWERNLFQCTDGYIRTDVSSKDCYHMKKCFSNVLKLDIVFICNMDPTALLRNWSKTLTSLTLRQLQKCNLDRLWKQINTMSSLRDLSLQHLSTIILPDAMPILLQLESFSLLGYKGNIVPILAALGSNCKRLALDYVACTSYQIFKMMEKNKTQLCPALTHLMLGELWMPEGDESWARTNYREVLTLFGMGMALITNLDLHCASEFQMDELSFCLSINFTYLTTLRLVYRHAYVGSFASSMDTLSPIKTIERVHFQFGYLSFDHFRRTVPIVFPNAKYIDIGCEDNDFKMQLKKRLGSKLICIK